MDRRTKGQVFGDFPGLKPATSIRCTSVGKRKLLVSLNRQRNLRDFCEIIGMSVFDPFALLAIGLLPPASLASLPTIVVVRQTRNR